MVSQVTSSKCVHFPAAETYNETFFYLYIQSNSIVSSRSRLMKTQSKAETFINADYVGPRTLRLAREVPVGGVG